MGVAKETRPNQESTPQPPVKKETDPKDDLIQDLQSDLAKLRKCVECVICQELLFEPYWLQCGHIFCYRCLVEWFEQKKSCPECRAKVDLQPTGAFLIRDMVETFIARAEVTAPTSIGEELRKSQKEAHEAVEKDKNCQHGPQAGLFRGIFKKGRGYKIKRGHRDPDDQVLRCPDCFWEVIEGICEACGNPVLDDNAEPGMSDAFSDVDMDFSDSGSDDDDDSTSSEEGDQDHPIDLEAEEEEVERELRRRARRRARLANNNSIIDLTGSQPPGLEPVDEDSEEEELDSEDSLNDFVEHDTPQRGQRRRNRRGTSELRETPSTYRETSQPATSSPVLRHRLADDTSEASEDSHNRTFDEEDSSAVSDGSSRIGGRRRGPYNYRSHSLASDEDDVSLLGGYQQLTEETAEEGEDDSDDTEGFSPAEDNVRTTSQRLTNPRALGLQASTNYAPAQSRRESTAPEEDSSAQSSPPPTRPTARRRGTVRHISRIPDDDEDDEDEWQDSDDDVDNEGDVRMSDNVSVASSRTSHVRARQARRRPVGRGTRNRNVRPTVVPDSDDESTTDASSPPARRRLPNGVGFFANNSSSAARRAMSGSGDHRRPDPRIQNLFSQMTRTRGSSDTSNNNPRNGTNNHPLAELGSASPARSVTPVPASAQAISSTVSSPEQPVSRPSNRTRNNNIAPARNMRAVSIASSQSQVSQPNSPRTRGPRSPGSSSPPRTDPNVPPVGLPYSLGIISTLRAQRLGHRSSRGALRSSASRNHMRSPLSPTHTGRGRTAVSVAPQPTFQSTATNSQRGSSAPAESPIISNHETPISESVIHQEGQTLMQQRRMRSLEMQRHAEQQRLRGEEMRRRLQLQQEQEALQRRTANAIPPQISTTAGLGRRTSRRNLQNQQPAQRLTPGSIPETAFPASRQNSAGLRTRRAGVFEIGESEDNTRQGGPLWNTGSNNLH